MHGEREGGRSSRRTVGGGMGKKREGRRIWRNGGERQIEEWERES